MADFFEQLAEMRRLVATGSWEQLDDLFRARCERVDAHTANKIAAADVTSNFTDCQCG